MRPQKTHLVYCVTDHLTNFVYIHHQHIHTCLPLVQLVCKLKLSQLLQRQDRNPTHIAPSSLYQSVSLANLNQSDKTGVICLEANLKPNSNCTSL